MRGTSSLAAATIIVAKQCWHFCHLPVLTGFNRQKLAETGKNSKRMIKLLPVMHFNRRHFKAQVTAKNDQDKWNIDHHFNT